MMRWSTALVNFDQQEGWQIAGFSQERLQDTFPLPKCFNVHRLSLKTPHMQNILLFVSSYEACWNSIFVKIENSQVLAVLLK